jgi:predicted transcriptional regulator
MADSSVLTLRLDAKLKKQLERLSKSMNRTRSFVASEAIREYVERQGKYQVDGMRLSRTYDFVV